jgi:hypothetical protein
MCPRITCTASAAPDEPAQQASLFRWWRPMKPVCSGTSSARSVANLLASHCRKFPPRRDACRRKAILQMRRRHNLTHGLASHVEVTTAASIATAAKVSQRRNTRKAGDHTADSDRRAGSARPGREAMRADLRATMRRGLITAPRVSNAVDGDSLRRLPAADMRPAADLTLNHRGLSFLSIFF